MTPSSTCTWCAWRPGRRARGVGTVDDNQVGAPGQLLIRIDPATLQAQLAQAVANQANAAASLLQAKAQPSWSRRTQSRHARRRRRRGQRVERGDDLKRDLALVASQALARQQLDDATASAASTAASLVAAKKSLDSAEAQRGVTLSQIEAADANLKSMAAQAEQARLNLSYENDRAE